MAVVRRSERRFTAYEDVTIGEAFAEFLKEKRADNRTEAHLLNIEQSLGYLCVYAGYLLQYSKSEDSFHKPQYVNELVRTLDREMIVDWKIDLQNAGTSITSINHYVRDVRTFLNWCFSRNYLSSYKIEELKAATPQKKSFEDEDISKLLKKPVGKDDESFTEWRNWAIATLITDMGARAGSITAMRIMDIDFKKATVYLAHTKEKKLEYHQISTACVKVLREYIKTWRDGVKPEEPLFPKCNGEPMDYNALHHSFARFCAKRGVKQSNLHGLRHSFATKVAINTNGNYAQVQVALGHATMEMAQHYVDLSKIKFDDYNTVSPLAELKGKKTGAPVRAIRAKRAG